MAARSWKGVHLGYGLGSNQYRIYHPEKKKVLERRDVEFHEGRNPTSVGDNDGNWTESELEPEKWDTQNELVSLPNTLWREETGQVRKSKCSLDHIDPAGGESPYNKNSSERGRSERGHSERGHSERGRSERGCLERGRSESCCLESGCSESGTTSVDGIDNSHHFPEETIERSHSGIQVQDFLPQIIQGDNDKDKSEDKSEDKLEEDLAIEPLNEPLYLLKDLGNLDRIFDAQITPNYIITAMPVWLPPKHWRFMPWTTQ